MPKKYGKIKGPKTPEQIKKSQKRTTIIIGVAAVAVMAGGLAIPKLIGGGSKVPSVAVAAVESGNITAILDTSGMVTSLNTKTYFSPVNAAIRSYDLKVGEVVKQGDMLVAFETDTLERDNQKAELTASVTKNTNRDTLDKVQKTLNEAGTAATNVNIIQGDIDNFKAYINNLNQAVANRTQELANAAVSDASNAAAEQGQQLSNLYALLTPATTKESLQTQNAGLEIDIADLEYEVTVAKNANNEAGAKVLEGQIAAKKKMLKENKKSIEKAVSKLGEYANSTVADIQNEISALSAGAGAAGGSDPSSDAQIAQWQLDLQDAQSTLAELQSNLAEAKAKVTAGEGAQMTEAGRTVIENNNNMADLEVSSLDELLQKGREGIKAEFNGIIAKADLVPGATVTQGIELVTIASNRDVAVKATVSKYDYDKLKIGQKADITIADKAYKGTVSSISKVAQQNEKGAPVITCEVKIDNPDDDIFLGVEAKVSITTASVDNVTMVPAMAVNTGKDSTFCYVVEDGKIAKRDVVTGVSSTEYTEVTSGLKAGDNVIPELPDGLTEGMDVEAAGSELPEAGAATVTGE